MRFHTNKGPSPLRGSDLVWPLILRFNFLFLGAIEIAFIVWGYLLFISKFLDAVEICSKRCLRITQKFLESRQEVPKKNGPHIRCCCFTTYKKSSLHLLIPEIVVKIKRRNNEIFIFVDLSHIPVSARLRWSFESILIRGNYFVTKFKYAQKQENN